MLILILHKRFHAFTMFAFIGVPSFKLATPSSTTLSPAFKPFSTTKNCPAAFGQDGNVYSLSFVVSSGNNGEPLIL